MRAALIHMMLKLLRRRLLVPRSKSVKLRRYPTHPKMNQQKPPPALTRKVKHQNRQVIGSSEFEMYINLMKY